MMAKKTIDSWIRLMSEEKSSGVAIRALSDYGEEAIPAVLEALRAPRNRESYENLGAVLFNIGAPAVPYLIDALTRADSPYKGLAASILGRLRDTRASQPLIDALQDKDQYLRWITLRALGELRDELTYSYIVERLRDRSKLVRLMAIDLVGRLRLDESLPTLEALAESKDIEVSTAAMNALRAIRFRDQ